MTFIVRIEIISKSFSFGVEGDYYSVRLVALQERRKHIRKPMKSVSWLSPFGFQVFGKGKIGSESKRISID